MTVYPAFGPREGPCRMCGSRQPETMHYYSADIYSDEYGDYELAPARMAWSCPDCQAVRHTKTLDQTLHPPPPRPPRPPSALWRAVQRVGAFLVRHHRAT